MKLSLIEKEIIENSIRDIKDFPKPGIVFKDITTLLNDKEAYGVLMNHLYTRYKEYNLNFIAGIDARGFIFGAALAQMLGIGFVPIRKKGKLPYTTIAEKYSLEYGVDEVEIHIDAFSKVPHAKVLLIDDLIATGGTANAAAKLINQAGAECVESCFILGLTFLDGIKNLQENTPVYTVVEVH
ncbi:MAG: adenine phosphoribosyltransferase [Epsilonproteobacteria bacterium]|nr:adenine phosphoribosyltransferase [Campylobacterota bacterium]OIO16812.1 MAG: adenine phosphoribosyltransferase [Helicobacteraceae bacterium CG1_02_36_14]PIP09377.1 MAG: adenine phosphoribosyltransferase [Sulfurimonas sp. CG23_combo_of_CG06-09_8_20_14_all_36_33]PIS26039.1 MAG: adenine phosphoribosyltransferase [Sulfurimonas sp. CG08_land_8_20_14_0_20_36_33]PIU35304.1 MAG: adenine phosphoribosyltransferase [Sulfurimonas sp. CG07_land_8_20_14_0_80_36_56]PIV02842.1 MAG: adenine phosphoribosylt